MSVLYLFESDIRTKECPGRTIGFPATKPSLEDNMEDIFN